MAAGCPNPWLRPPAQPSGRPPAVGTDGTACDSWPGVPKHDRWARDQTSRWRHGERWIPVSNPPPLAPVTDQRHHLGGEALQPLDAGGDGLAANVEDQLMQPGGGERIQVAADVVVLAGDIASHAHPVRIDAAIVLR